MLDDEALDNLIRLMGQEGTLSLLTPFERVDLDTHMDTWASTRKATLGSGREIISVVGSPGWYEEKRRKFLEIINRRRELHTV